MSKFVHYINSWGQPESVAFDEIKSFTEARNPKQTIIRFKSGGYGIVDASYEETRKCLDEMNKKVSSWSDPIPKTEK